MLSFLMKQIKKLLYSSKENMMQSMKLLHANILIRVLI